MLTIPQWKKRKKYLVLWIAPISEIVSPDSDCKNSCRLLGTSASPKIPSLWEVDAYKNFVDGDNWRVVEGHYMCIGLFHSPGTSASIISPKGQVGVSWGGFQVMTVDWVWLNCTQQLWANKIPSFLNKTLHPLWQSPLPAWQWERCLFPSGNCLQVSNFWDTEF